VADVTNITYERADVRIICWLPRVNLVDFSNSAGKMLYEANSYYAKLKPKYCPKLAIHPLYMLKV